MIGVMADQMAGTICPPLSIGDFSSWMASEQRRIFLLCRRMLQDPDEASSATQDVFLKAYKAFQRSSSQATELDIPAKWVTRIAVNTCLDRLRSKAWKIWSRRPSAETEEGVLQTTKTDHPGPDRVLFAKEITARLEGALQKLSPRQRAVFMLRHYDDLALEDIGSILHLDAGTVKAHLHRAITKLRSELTDLYRRPDRKHSPETA